MLYMQFHQAKQTFIMRTIFIEILFSKLISMIGIKHSFPRNLFQILLSVCALGSIFHILDIEVLIP